jgi:hypothetical protein
MNRNRIDSTLLPGEAAARNKRRLEKQTGPELQLTMSNGKASLPKDDEGLGMTMEEFVREKLTTTLRPASNKDEVSKPITDSTLRPVTPGFSQPSKLDPPAEPTNRLKPNNLGQS